MPALIPENRIAAECAAALASPGARETLHHASAAGLGLFAASLHAATRKPILYVGASEEKTRTAFGDASLFSDRARFFPTREPPPLDDPIASGERVAILEELTKSGDLLIFTTAAAIAIPTHAPAKLKEAGIALEVGKNFPMSRFLEKLEEWGYLRADTVMEKKEFAVRGGIVDCFPISADSPFRVEWFGDEIDSVRLFDPASQRSIRKAPALELFPPESAEDLSATLLDYLPRHCAVIAEEAALYRDDPVIGESEEAALAATQAARMIREWTEKHPLLTLSPNPGEARREWPFKPVENFSHRFRDFLDLLRIEEKNKQTVFIFTRQASRLKEILAESGLEPAKVIASPLSQGFAVPEQSLLVYTDAELFGRVVSPFRRISPSRPVSVEELRDGDVVVHSRHGIARYDGLVPIDVEGKKQDYIALTFARDDKLYVPLEEMEMVERYVGPPGRTPQLSKLGGQEWKSAKSRARKAAEEVAGDLVKLYAARSSISRAPYTNDTPWQREMEEAFPFEETPDQEKAIRDTKADMEKGKPMDRLIVGDVGFGKTEVALRAAFKAVMDGKQVALLAPTTVLAQQHYETFSERLATFPIKIDMLSRFKKKKEQQETLLRLFTGKVDILIGTHRILQKDVHFKNLGLLIVDEEQRFGVAHKEALKKLKQNVDCLTLSATPIPRTFYLSLMGARDITVINTPPKERLPVKTFVAPHDPALIRKAIARELAREGQVYYLYNRVETLKEKERELKLLVPEAKIVSAHGQMKGDDLEEVMWEFMKGFYDVLLCTTIIENGLDIPRVNTLIVENAERFGLSQLYQLRGRVGRSDRQAYAYFLTPARGITEDAGKRLSAIQEFTSLGSGYHVAIKDLEIRGAGNLLGMSQHGHLASVGYHLYCQMLAEEIKKLKGDSPPPQIPQIRLDLPIAAFIPDTYVDSRAQKLDLYRRATLCKADSEVEELYDEIVDRYGDPPAETANLMELIKLRIRCLESHVYEITAAEGEALIRFWDGRKELSVPFDGKLPVKISFDLLKSKLAVIQ